MTHIRQWTWWSVLAVMSLLSTKYKHWINVVASVKLYFPVQLEWMWLIERQSFILRHSVFLRSFFSLSLKLIQLLTTTRTHHSRSPFIWFDTWNDVFFIFFRCIKCIWFVHCENLLLKFDFIELSRAFSRELFINKRWCTQYINIGCI